MTLDAGGTTLKFSADLDRRLSAIVRGFETVRAFLAEVPVAISFAFVGPADYPNGIIGGVPLGPILEDRFATPRFISNAGDLFV